MSITLDGIPVIPTYGKIIVRLHKREKVTASGIIIPENAEKETDYYGEVVAVSRSEKDVKVSDNVILRKHAGVTAQVDQRDGKYKFYNKTDIFYVC